MSRRARLRTLGSIELTGLEPTLGERLVAQPKRLALLAFLAARPAGERVGRDRIVAIFWPEHPTDRARGNLRTAIYFLRNALGHDTIDGHGDTVGISPHHLICDAAALLADFPTRPLAELLDLYRGEFLDALHLSGAPDFERWVDRKRAALRARASEIAWRLSERAEAADEWISAAGFGRRATDLAVDLEQASQRLIELFDRAGDRGAALAEYERLTTRLEEDFDASPSPETAALIERIRERRSSEIVVARPRPNRRARRRRSLAVLPFENLGEEPDAYLAHGLGEDLLTALTRIRDVRVVSRTSVRDFATEPPASMRVVHDSLGVDLVLEGSVQLQGDRVRINVQLFDAKRDEHLWAETYDRRLTDIFEIQSDVALRISRALESELSPREHQRLRDPPTNSVESYELYLKGKEIWSRREPEAASRAASLFRRALDIAPRFSLARVGLADAWLVRAATGAGSLDHAHREARAAVDRALADDPELGEARATSGIILTFLEWNHPAAEREFWRATELSPGYATAHQWYGQFLSAHGNGERGLDELDAALDLDPSSPAVNEGRGLALYHLNRTDEAVSQFRKTLDLDPDFWRARLGLSLCCAADGDLQAATDELLCLWSAGGYGGTTVEAEEAEERSARDAREALEHLLNCARMRIGKVSVVRVMEVILLMLLARHEEAVRSLEAAYDDRSLAFVATMYAPVLDPLTGDGRFEALVDEADLMLPRWRSTRGSGSSRTPTSTEGGSERST